MRVPVGRATAAVLCSRGHEAILDDVPVAAPRHSVRVSTCRYRCAERRLPPRGGPNLRERNRRRAGRVAGDTMRSTPQDHGSDRTAPFAPARRSLSVRTARSAPSIWAQLLSARHVTAPIVALGSTVAYSRADGPAGVHIWFVRDRIECATLPAAASAVGLALCESLFGKRFAGLTDVIAATLSNVNGQVQFLAMVLANFTRMERAAAVAIHSNMQLNPSHALRWRSIASAWQPRRRLPSPGSRPSRSSCISLYYVLSRAGGRTCSRRCMPLATTTWRDRRRWSYAGSRRTCRSSSPRSSNLPPSRAPAPAFIRRGWRCYPYCMGAMCVRAMTFFRRSDFRRCV